MSRRTHRHGEHGHPRPHRSDGARPTATPRVGPAIRPPADDLPLDARPLDVRPEGEHSGAPPSTERIVPAQTTAGEVDRASPAAPVGAPIALAVLVVEERTTSPTSMRPAIPANVGLGPLAPGTGEAPSPGVPEAMVAAAPRTSTCTTAQLRRFIKSRAYIPMHELRRRFAIDGPEDDVTGVDLRGSWVFVGLPGREGSMLGELLRNGEVGFELSHDPVTPIIVGVFPMRPIPRP